MTRLVLTYKRKKNQIKRRLNEFKKLKRAKDKDIFAELCFCILTPQSKAVHCDRAVKELKRTGLLLKGSRRAIKNKLRRVRFPNNKASYLVAARRCLSSKRALDIKNVIDSSDAFKTREWLVKNIKGLGYKEASHFLRNIGCGRDLAILDVHILRNLARYGIIKNLPKTLSKSAYLAVEDKLRRFSKKVKIPMDHLDLLFWSNETGFVFK